MIFVYIRIFMVVYDRENLIKTFRDKSQSSSLSIKSNRNSCAVNTQIANNQQKNESFLSRCCICFRPRLPDKLASRTSAPSCSYIPCPSIEQKQNGYVVYRFSNNTIGNNNAPSVNPNTGTTSSPHSRRSSSKASIFSRSCKNTAKQMNNISDDHYQYRCNYFTHRLSEYQFHQDDPPTVELKALEKSCQPPIKRRSRSLEQSAISKIRDLNTELSHSRQLKAAAAAAAAVTTTTTNSKDMSQQEVGVDDFY